jgi:hypothetical protein
MTNAMKREYVDRSPSSLDLGEVGRPRRTMDEGPRTNDF